MADLSTRQMLRVAASGAVMALVAGYVNAVTVNAAVYATATSHMTGVVARLAAATVRASSVGGNSAAVEAVALGGFLLGATVAGAIVGPSIYYRMRVTTRHGAALLAESAALVLAAVLLHTGSMAGQFFAGVAMGLQNGLTTVYSGALLRTTHVTGVCTDVGVLAGQAAHQALHRVYGKPEEHALVQTEVWRFKFLLPLLLAFYLGAVAGVQAYITAGIAALAFPTVLTAVAGVAAIAYDRYKLAHERRRPSPFSRMYEKTVGLLGRRGRDPRGGLGTADAAAASADLDMFAIANEELPSADALATLGVRGDWDTLPHAMYLRHKQRQQLVDEASTGADGGTSRSDTASTHGPTAAAVDLDHVRFTQSRTPPALLESDDRDEDASGL